MREIRPSGSVEGVRGNPDPYSDLGRPVPTLVRVLVIRLDGKLRKSTIGSHSRRLESSMGSGQCVVLSQRYGGTSQRTTC